MRPHRYNTGPSWHNLFRFPATPALRVLAQLGATESAVSAVFDIGPATGEWKLDNAGFALFAEIATNYDRQLRSAPLWAITDASERLDRFTAGMSYQAPMRSKHRIYTVADFVDAREDRLLANGIDV
jgi:hypothetical protein